MINMLHTDYIDNNISNQHQSSTTKLIHNSNIYHKYNKFNIHYDSVPIDKHDEFFTSILIT